MNDSLRDLLGYSTTDAGLYFLEVLIWNGILQLFSSDYVIHNEAIMRLPMTIACVASIPFVHLLSRRFCHPFVAMVITTAWVFNPFAITWSRIVYTYTFWPIWCMILILCTFHLTSVIKERDLSYKDWLFFHFGMFIAIQSNVFVILIIFSLSPHILATMYGHAKHRTEFLRWCLASYGPHVLPTVLIFRWSIKNGMRGERNPQDHSWMQSATWTAPFDILDISLSSLVEYGSLALLLVLVACIIMRLYRNGSSRGLLQILQKEECALLFAGILQPTMFIALQLTGTPSWVMRYMLHLIPIWLILIGASIAPVGSTFLRLLDTGNKTDLIVRRVGVGLVLFLVVSSIISVKPAPDHASEDFRGAVSILKNHMNESENQVILTYPTDFVYNYYFERFEIDADSIVGAFKDLPNETLDSVITPETQSVHRIRFASYDDTSLHEYLEPGFEMVAIEQISGMEVEHWVRIGGP